MSSTNMSRRALVAGIATVPAATVLTSPIGAAIAEPDPIYAVIEKHKRLQAAYFGAEERYYQAEKWFKDTHGTLTPSAFSKELRGELAAELGVEWRTVKIGEHELIDKIGEIDWIKPHPDIVAGLHRELDQQTAAYEMKLKPVELAKDEACDAHLAMTGELFSTVPATAAGLAALLKYVQENPELSSGVNEEGLEHGGFIDGDEYKDMFLDTIAKSAAALAGLTQLQG